MICQLKIRELKKKLVLIFLNAKDVKKQAKETEQMTIEEKEIVQ